MKKECFTCANKVTTTLTIDQRKKIRNEMIAEGIKFPIAPELIFHCSVSGSKISQIDPACENYQDDPDMSMIRKALSETCTKLRVGLNQKEE